MLFPASYCGRERTIKLAVKKELPVLGIEADDIGRQHIDGEIRCELWNVFAGIARRVGLRDLAVTPPSTARPLLPPSGSVLRAFFPTTGMLSSSSRACISR